MDMDHAGGVGTRFIDSVPLRSSESFTADGVWQRTADLNEARSSHTATLLPGGSVLIAGGLGFMDLMQENHSYKALTSAELYDPTAAAWSYTGSLNVPRFRHTATLLDDGSVLIVGGIGADDGLLGSAEIYVRSGDSKAYGTQWPRRGAMAR
jgi:hypothetical protein